MPLIDTLNLLENQHVVNGSTACSAAGGNQLVSVQLPIYGPEKVVRAQMEYSREQFAKIPGSRFTEGELIRTPLDAAALARVRKVNFGIPDLSTFAMLGRNQSNPEPARRAHRLLADHSAHRRGAARIRAVLSRQPAQRFPRTAHCASRAPCS